MQASFSRYVSRFTWSKTLLSLVLLALLVRLLTLVTSSTHEEEGQEFWDRPTDFKFRENRTVFFTETNPKTRTTRSLLCALESAANVYDDFDVSSLVVTSCLSPQHNRGNDIGTFRNENILYSPLMFFFWELSGLAICSFLLMTFSPFKVVAVVRQDSVIKKLPEYITSLKQNVHLVKVDFDQTFRVRKKIINQKKHLELYWPARVGFSLQRLLLWRESENISGEVCPHWRSAQDDPSIRGDL